MSNFPLERVYIRSELQKVNPDLDIIFVPRTLYELIYIKAAIDEEMSAGACSLQHSDRYFCERFENKEEFAKTVREGHCWHICQFTDSPPTGEDGDLLRILVFRANSLALRQLPSKHFLTGREIAKCTTENLQYLQEHRKKFPDFLKKQGASWAYGVRGGAVNFGFPHHFCKGRVLCFPMGIRNARDAQVVRNAIALECSGVAENAFILYRACREMKVRGDMTCCSLSYGTSLFAGAFLDGAATVFHYMVEEERDIYAIIVSKKTDKHPFYIPDFHPIRSLLSMGEFFHARSLLPCDTLRNRIAILGIGPVNDDIVSIPSSLYSDSDNEDSLHRQLDDCHSGAIPVTIPRNI